MTRTTSITTDITPSSSVELPPNKAIAAGGSAGLSTVAVSLAVYYLAPDTPAHIIGLWDALIIGVTTFAATYFMPHGAVSKG